MGPTLQDLIAKTWQDLHKPRDPETPPEFVEVDMETLERQIAALNAQIEIKNVKVLEYPQPADPAIRLGE